MCNRNSLFGQSAERQIRRQIALESLCMGEFLANEQLLLAGVDEPMQEKVMSWVEPAASAITSLANNPAFVRWFATQEYSRAIVGAMLLDMVNSLDDEVSIAAGDIHMTTVYEIDTDNVIGVEYHRDEPTVTDLINAIDTAQYCFGVEAGRIVVTNSDGKDILCLKK